MHEQNTPLIRLAKRDDMPRWQVWWRPFCWVR